MATVAFKPTGETRRRLYPLILFLILLPLTVLINPFTACTKAISPFYIKVLSDFDSTSYFIAIDVKSPDYKGRTIIKNNNLFHYLNKTRGLDKEKYISFLTKLLTHHKTLKIGNDDLLEWKFKKVDNVESVLRDAGKGRDNFIFTYFNGSVLNIGLTEKEQNAVINQLFYWEVPAKIDKLTGDIIIG